MTDQHPITPSPEMVREWAKGCSPYDVPADHIANQAYRAGADRQLEACYEWLVSNDNPRWALALQEAMRPKPQGLAEKSLDLIDKIQSNKKMWQIEELDVVRRALKRLQELENNA